MTQVGQKIGEWLFARKTEKMLGAQWEIADCEAPDFIVTEGEKRFGLEVCQIFTGLQDGKGSWSKKNEAENQKRIDMYRRKYEKETNTLLSIRLMGETCDENMGELVQLLIEKEFSKKSPGYHEEFQVPFKKIMESEYRERFEALLSSSTRRRLKAFVTRLPESYTHCAEWYSLDDRVGSVGSASEQIDSAIEGKSKKLSEYKENSALDDIQLLIVADHLRASGMLELREHLEFDPRGFQVVYFLNYPKSAHVIGRVRKAA